MTQPNQTRSGFQPIRFCCGATRHEMWRLFSVACLVLLTGCIAAPLPHATRKSPSVSGKVIDEATGSPIEGAVVEVITTEGGAARHAWGSDDERPGPTSKTKADGEFHVGTGFNFHLFWYANISWQFHWPTGVYWRGQLSVKKNGYSDLKTPALCHWNGEYSMRLRDIRLIPISRKE